MRRLFVSALAFAAAATAAHAAPRVEAPWTRPAAQGTTGAGFMTLANPAGAADALVRVDSPLAREVQIHLSKVSGGMASMQRVPRLALPAGARVTFAPGGYHLMFMGLTRPLKAGEALPATLTFASGAKVKASFAVRIAPPVAEPHHH